MTQKPPRHPTPPPIGLIVPGSIAAHVKAEVEASAPELSPEMRKVLAVISVEVEQMIVEIDQRRIAAGDGLPLRVHRLEQSRAEHDEKWHRLRGYNEGNGWCGDVEARIAKTPEERAVEKSHHDRFRWGVAKITAILVLVGGLTVGWVRHYATGVIDEHDAMIEEKAKGQAWRDSVEERVRYLVNLFRRPGDPPLPIPPEPTP